MSTAQFIVILIACAIAVWLHADAASFAFLAVVSRIVWKWSA